MTFASLGLPAQILKGVRAAGLTEPTAIQSKAIPVILQGNDLIGAAQSGTGKTAAYLLPTLARLLDGPARLRAIVLTPTREHAAQIESFARDYARYTELRIGAVVGGVPLAPQERMLRDPGVDLLIAMPSRLLELWDRKCLNFEDVEILVLDEADRMVDMGMAVELRRLLKLLPETRQTLLFSASMPPELNRLGKEALIEPVRVDLAVSGQSVTGITHAIYPVPRHLKTELLDEMLTRTEVRSTIIFLRTREGADRLARQLERRGYTVASLHDHKSHSERERTIDDLKRGRVQLLVSTDVAARGIDLTGVAHVVNFDVPATPEDYVHRIARAGRPEAGGDAFTLMSPEEQRHMAAIERFVGRAIPRVLLPDFDYKVSPAQMQLAARLDEERARPAGVARVAARIAAIPRPTAPPPRNGLQRSSPPKPALLPAPKAKVAPAPAPKARVPANSMTPSKKSAASPPARGGARHVARTAPGRAKKKTVSARRRRGN